MSTTSDEDHGPTKTTRQSTRSGLDVTKAAVVLLVTFVIAIFVFDSFPDSGATPSPTTTMATTTSVPGPSRSTVKVQVVNASTVQGQAQKFANQLVPYGWDVLPGITANTSLGVASTTVYYAPGFKSEALTIASELGVPASQVAPMPANLPALIPSGTDVVVWLGQDLATR